MRVRPLVVIVVSVVFALVVVACGGDDSSDDGAKGPDPARDKELAEAVAFHDYDFPAGWAQIDFGEATAPPTMATLAQCLGQGGKPTATATRGYHFGPGINKVAVVEVRVLRTAAAASTVIGPAVKPEFPPCVVDKVKGLLSTSLGSDLTLTELTGASTNIATGAANGVAIDMTAHITGARGALTSYPAAVFVQRGRVVATITLLSDNLSTVDDSRTLASAVANRMPAD